jgi:hypothetical protein
MYGATAIEHGSTGPGRWLRERRYRLTMWITLAEGALYLLGVLNRWEAVGLAVIGVGLWWLAGRRSSSDVFRQSSWIFAASQVLVLCVPIALAILSALAIGVIVILAIVALVLLFKERA